MEVHRWLDEFAGQPPYGMRPRHLTHHEVGIREARHIFGREAEPAAMQHVGSGLNEEGWTEKDPFPKNREHYKRIGLW